MTLAKQGTADWFAVPLVEYSPTVALVLYLQIKTLMTIVKQNLKIKEIIDKIYENSTISAVNHITCSQVEY